ncbi:MAG TPA: hypothetical protein VGE59_00355 [Patescibacteria group bacterium]
MIQVRLLAMLHSASCFGTFSASAQQKTMQHYLIDSSVVTPLSELMEQAARMRWCMRRLGSKATVRIAPDQRPTHHQVMGWAWNLAYWTMEAIDEGAIKKAPNQPRWFRRVKGLVTDEDLTPFTCPAETLYLLDLTVVYLSACLNLRYDSNRTWHMTFRGSVSLHKWLGFLVEFGDGPARRVHVAHDMDEAGVRLEKQE